VLATLAVALLLLANVAPARADGITVRQAVLVAGDNGYHLEADFGIALNPTLKDALDKGVALYFVMEFNISRPHFFGWFHERIASYEQQYKLTYNALTRQYRVTIGTLFQNFSTLHSALALLGHVRSGDIVPRDALKENVTYDAEVRLRLDTSQLPKPFQVNAIASRDWNANSDWYRWTVTR
jgi:hypothetical protein